MNDQQYHSYYSRPDGSPSNAPYGDTSRAGGTVPAAGSPHPPYGANRPYPNSPYPNAEYPNAGYPMDGYPISPGANAPFGPAMASAPYQGLPRPGAAPSAARRRSNAIAIVAFVTAIAVLVGCAVALRRVPSASRTAAQASSGSTQGTTASVTLSADQVCANVTSAMSSIDGWTKSDGSAPDELTVLANDRTACGSGTSNLTADQLSTMSSHTTDALLAWYSAMQPRYGSDTTLNYQLDGQWSDETRALKSAFSKDGWQDDPTYAAEQAAKLRTSIDSMQSHLDATFSDLHGRENAVAGIVLDDSASEADIWNAIDSATQAMGVTYAFGSDAADCGDAASQDKTDDGSAIASFCFTDATTDHRNTITFVNDAADWNEIKANPFLLDATKHELAHRSISIVCGTTEPNIVGTRTEAVTNAYSFTYLGGDRQRSENMQAGLEDYQVQDQDIQVAQKIHDSGTCRW